MALSRFERTETILPKTPSTPRGALSWLYENPELVIFIGAFGLRLILILLFPPIIATDPVLRLATRDNFLVGYQLPVLGSALYVLAQIMPDAFSARCLIALGGAAGVVGFYRLATNFLDRQTAFAGACIYATHPFLTALSTVPFQETWMLAFLFFAFDFYFRAKYLLASAALALACLTRYEAWAACPVLVLAFLWQHARTLPLPQRIVTAAKAIALFCWAPLVWIALQGGIGPRSAAVVDTAWHWARLWREVYVAWITAKFTPIPVLALACIGAWMIWRRKSLSAPFLTLAGFLCLFLLAVPFSAQGVAPDPQKFVTSREAVIPMAALILIAACGLAWLPKLRTIFAAIAVIAGIFGCYQYMERESSTPEIALSYQLARYCDRLPSGGRILILARALPADALQNAIDQARRKGTTDAVKQAEQAFNAFDLRPVEFQRTVVESRQPRSRFDSLPAIPRWRASENRQLPNASDFAWVMVWSNYQPERTAEQQWLAATLKGRTKAGTLEASPLKIEIYRKSN